MSKEIKILIAEDHGIVRMGLTMMLQEMSCENIMEVSSCEELTNELKNNSYSHLILDLVLGDGNSIELIPTFKQLYPKMSILVHSMQPAAVYDKALAKYGIFGYASKTFLENDLKNILSDFLINKSSTENNIQVGSNTNPFAKLTSRELEILHYILNGYGTKNISIKLGTKMNTISTFKSNIFDKLAIKSIPQLMQLADLHQISY